MVLIFPGVVLLIGNTDTKHSETDDSNGENHTSHHDGSKPRAVCDLVSMCAHSSTPFASGVTSFFSGLSFFW